MNFFQKAQLFLTLLLLGNRASFTFNAGKHKYEVSLAYTDSHQYLSTAQILTAIEGFAVGTNSLPYSVTVGNTMVTFSEVS